MKKIALLLGVAALAACSEAEAPEAEATEAAPVAEATAAAAGWQMEPGTYEYTRSDGRAGVNTVNADGTYSNAITGGEIETGKWGPDGDLSCLTPDEGDKRCYTFTQPDAEGNFTGTTTDGVTVEVRKVA